MWKTSWKVKIHLYFIKTFPFSCKSGYFIVFMFQNRSGISNKWRSAALFPVNELCCTHFPGISKTWWYLFGGHHINNPAWHTLVYLCFCSFLIEWIEWFVCLMTQVRKMCVQSPLSSIIFLILNTCQVPMKLTNPLGHSENWLWSSWKKWDVVLKSIST